MTDVLITTSELRQEKPTGLVEPTPGDSQTEAELGALILEEVLNAQQPDGIITTASSEFIADNHIDPDGGIVRHMLETGQYEKFAIRNISHKDPKDNNASAKRSSRQRTDGDTTDSVKIYLREIGAHPLLAAEGEVYLSKYVQAGIIARALRGDYPDLSSGDVKKYTGYVEKLKQDLAFDDNLSEEQLLWLNRVSKDGSRAKDYFIKSNLRLTVSQARMYTGRAKDMDLLDLIQEGNMGLAHAIDKFDWRKGLKFSTYATNWIKQAITRGIATQDKLIRLPVHALGEVEGIDRILNQALESHPDHNLSVEEISKLTGYPIDKIRAYLPYLGKGKFALSLNERVGDDQSSEMGDFIEDEQSTGEFDEALKNVDFGLLRELLDKLDERELSVIMQRLQDTTLEEIGKEFGVTRERVRQIEKKAKAKIVTKLARLGISSAEEYMNRDGD